jgi:Fic family protein
MAFDPVIDHGKLKPLLDSLEEARQEMYALDVPPMLERWMRRFTEARGAHMSTRIEGNPMTEEQVREAFARPERGTDEHELENRNYRDAVRFGRQFADDASADIDGGLIRSLHFLIVREVDRYGTAGQYRTQQNAVRSGGRVVYMPPPPLDVRPLMDGLIAWLHESRGSVHPLVVGAVAHIGLINIHPFDDGNGRTARALTSYFLARGGWRLRGFVSSEQVFGEDVDDYYAALRAFGERYPGPKPDLTEWVQWFLEQFRGAVTSRLEDADLREFHREMTADVIGSLEGLAPRAASALTYVRLFGRVTSSEYAEEAGVSRATAVADLNSLVAARYLRRMGTGRATRYTSGDRFPFGRDE